MKKFVIIAAVLAMLTASFALPSFAEEGCDSNVNYLSLGREQLETEDFAGALRSANCGLSFDSESYAFFMLRADIYCDMGDTENSVADFSRAIELRPDSFEAYNYRGWAHYQHGNLDAAMADVNHAISLNRDFAYAYNNRGLIWQAMGFPELARQDYQRAIDLGFVQNWAATNLYNVNFEIDKLNQE